MRSVVVRSAVVRSAVVRSAVVRLAAVRSAWVSAAWRAKQQLALCWLGRHDHEQVSEPFLYGVEKSDADIADGSADGQEREVDRGDGPRGEAQLRRVRRTAWRPSWLSCTASPACWLSPQMQSPLMRSPLLPLDLASFDR